MFTVHYRCRDGSGTQVWETTDNRSEAMAQRNWCFADPSLQPTMVWVLDASGHMIGDPLTASD
jgi:hypothetical protein